MYLRGVLETMPVDYAAKIILCTGILLLPGACALTSGKGAASMSLMPSPHFAFARINEDPPVYRQSRGETPPLFLTAIRDCSLSKHSSAIAAARQLLVGLEKIRIIKKSTILLAGKQIIRTAVLAKLDGKPLELLTYTLKQDACVQDYVLWRDCRSSATSCHGLAHDPTFEAYLSSIISVGGHPSV